MKAKTRTYICAALFAAAGLLAGGCNRDSGSALGPAGSKQLGGEQVDGIERATSPFNVQNFRTQNAPGAATQTVKAATSTDLISEAGFGMISTNFSKETGREDPFSPLGEDDIPGSVLIKSNPERFRVCGIARKSNGSVIALLEIGAETLLVHLNDTLKNGYKVRAINLKSVILVKDKQEITVSLRPSENKTTTSDNVKALPGGKQLPQLPELYGDYLTKKYGKGTSGTDEGIGGLMGQTFTNYLKKMKDGGVSSIDQLDQLDQEDNTTNTTTSTKESGTQNEKIIKVY